MKKSIIIIIAVVLIVAIVGGSLAVLYCNNQNPASSSLSVEQIRDRAMTYIAANHTDSVQLMQALSWTGGRQDSGLLGSETYLYSSGNWTVEITYPVVPDPAYAISANYSSQTDNVNWAGTYSNGIVETSKSLNIPTVTLTLQEQVRDIAVLFIQAYHNQTISYLPESFTWSGGRITPEMLVGSETYSYQSSGWIVSMQYPVVPNAIYSINATYTSGNKVVVSWQGTLQSGVVIETAFKLES